ncbi:MAG: pseudouridine synthase [Clostridia bacterium]|nr:pseudouridine synthase [Clostridia bacterium]
MATFLMMNKPRGVITACRDDTHRTVMEFLPPQYSHLRPVGRLDKETEGLLLFTDDGKFTQYLLSPESRIAKTYAFLCFGTLTEEGMQELRSGTTLYANNRPAKPAEVLLQCHCRVRNVGKYISERRREHHLNNPDGNASQGIIRITEGQKHEVRLMLRTVHCAVLYLKRLSVGNLLLDTNLQPGECRLMTDEEVQRLLQDAPPLTEQTYGALLPVLDFN